MKKAWVLSYPLSAQWRLWSDWADAQADLRPHWAHMPFCRFRHALAHIVCIQSPSIITVISIVSLLLPLPRNWMEHALKSGLFYSQFFDRCRNICLNFRATINAFQIWFNSNTGVSINLMLTKACFVEDVLRTQIIIDSWQSIPWP